MMKYVVLAAVIALGACGTDPCGSARGPGGAGSVGAGTGAVIGAIGGPVGVGTGALIGAGVGGVAGAVTSPNAVDLGKPVWR